MKIRYKILWIEDHPHEVQAAKNSIQRFLSTLGFDLDVDARKTISEDDIHALGEQLKIYNPYDLVVFDYDLGAGKINGAEIAQGLRQSIYTDMIFYSSKSVHDMRSDLFKKHVDGVYVVNRTNLHEDASEIIEDQVKRICDLNNMRGVVLDEMSKLDSQLRDLLKQHFESIDDEKKATQIRKLKAKIKGRGDTFHKDAEKMDHEYFVTVISNPLKTDFNSIRERLASIGVLKTLDKTITKKLEELQRLRNELAHQESTLDETKGRIFLTNSKEYGDGFDHDAFIKIRQDLRNVSDKISTLFPS